MNVLSVYDPETGTYTTERYVNQYISQPAGQKFLTTPIPESVNPVKAGTPAPTTQELVKKGKLLTYALIFGTMLILFPQLGRSIKKIVK